MADPVSPRRLFGRKGFTLIEVILSIMILTLGIVSVQRVFMRSLSALSVIENRGQAEQLLEKKIWEIGEEVRTLGPKFRKRTESGLLLGSDRTYPYVININEISSDSNLLEAQIVVSWGNLGMAHAIRRTFYLMVPYENWKK